MNQDANKAGELSARETLADAELAVYAFGDGVKVVQHSGWDTNDRDDFTKIVYVEYDDDAPDADSHKISFHVRFDADGSVEDAYGLEMEHGNDIGKRGAVALLWLDRSNDSQGSRA